MSGVKSRVVSGHLVKHMEKNPSTAIFLFSSRIFNKSNDELSNTKCMPETVSLTPIDEEYLTISSTSVTSLSRGSSEALAATMVTPQPCVCGPFSSTLTDGEIHDSGNEWEDLEELVEEKEEEEDCTRVCDKHQVINRQNTTREKNQH